MKLQKICTDDAFNKVMTPTGIAIVIPNPMEIRIIAAEG
jgi:hypothetical protein